LSRYHRFHGDVEIVEHRTQLRQEPLAHLGERDAARRAVQEADAELLLERADGLAEARARHAQMRRRFGEARALGDRHEGIHLGQPEAAH
jgi:hypothetical protein